MGLNGRVDLIAAKLERDCLRETRLSMVMLFTAVSKARHIPKADVMKADYVTIGRKTPTRR
jgi:hypothetical protein